MAANVKTPVMVLQELTVKRGMQSPEYSLIHSKQGTHENEFHYQVKVARVSAIGMGRSKQVAKHDAARKALDMLESLGIYVPGETTVKAPGMEVPNSPAKHVVNCIGTLGDLCVEYKIPIPIFIEVSDVGPPHCKEFTYQCKVASIVTKATAGTKKQAKQLAAKEMLERIHLALPELLAEFSEKLSNQGAIEDQNAEIIAKYKELHKFNKSKPNLAFKIEDYDKFLKNVMENKEVSSENLITFFNGDHTEGLLKNLLALLELEYMIETLNDYPLVVLLTINTDVPFTILAQGNTFEEASQAAILKALEHIKLLVK